jgi:hypothetical protein
MPKHPLRRRHDQSTMNETMLALWFVDARGAERATRDGTATIRTDATSARVYGSHANGVP